MGPNDFIDIMLKFMPYLVGAGGIIAAIVYRRQNKRIKEAEAVQHEAQAQQSNIATQAQEIDLGRKFMKDSFDMQLQMQEMLKTNNADTAAIVEKVGGLETKVGDLETKVGDLEQTVNKKITNVNRAMSGYNKRLGVIERYLDGKLKEFAAEEAESHKKAS